MYQYFPYWEIYLPNVRDENTNCALRPVSGTRHVKPSLAQSLQQRNTTIYKKVKTSNRPTVSKSRHAESLTFRIQLTPTSSVHHCCNTAGDKHLVRNKNTGQYLQRAQHR